MARPCSTFKYYRVKRSAFKGIDLIHHGLPDLPKQIEHCLHQFGDRLVTNIGAHARAHQFCAVSLGRAIEGSRIGAFLPQKKELPQQVAAAGLSRIGNGAAHGNLAQPPRELHGEGRDERAGEIE